MVETSEHEAWFASQPERVRILLLLRAMHWLTIAMREVATADGLDSEQKWEAAWMTSECNHRLTGYITALMTDKPRYPDDVIVGILFDYLGHPALAPYAGSVWTGAVSDATRLSPLLC